MAAQVPNSNGKMLMSGAGLRNVVHTEAHSTETQSQVRILRDPKVSNMRWRRTNRNLVSFQLNPGFGRQRQLTRRLLLREAVQRAKTPYQVDCVNSDDPTFREELS
jgi:hypothetical protein